MKKKSFIVLFVVMTGVLHTGFAQSSLLLESIKGKWNVKEYHNNRKTAINTGYIDFQQDGVFESKGTYFGDRRGLYRTDESRSVVLIDNGRTTEWRASLVNNVLRLEQHIKRQRKPSVYLILIKDGKDENQQVLMN
jgi:hypothetical protein